jgi:adenylate cyclase class IV
VASQLAKDPPQFLEQFDTFFHVPHGRLKLRQLAANAGELIFYERPDQPGPKTSTYSVTRTDQPEALRETLSQTLGLRGQVRKRRWLFLVDQSRLPFDEVEGLGGFLEVEVVLRPDQTEDEGARIATGLRLVLGVQEEDLVQGAYLDLLADRRLASRG